MFWRMAGLSTTSPVESLLDRDGFTLEELLDEDELIQECKSLNTRLINFLRDKSQIQQLLKYIIEEPLEGADNKRAFKFPFIACEIFTCEIEVIIKTTVEDEELMGLLFSFLEPDRPHGTLLAGYFSKVVICLLLRKTAVVMCYIQAHQEILKKLVDLIGITSIMEVLIRLVGADDNMHAFNEDSSHWLANTDLLEMLVDKLTPPNTSEARANAADTLSAVSFLSQSELATKLCSPSFIAKLFHHGLKEEDSKSTLVHTLTVCISLLDPKQYMIMGTGRGQQCLSDARATATPETIDGMLQRLGGLLKLLNVGGDERVLPTTYGQLCPPLGTHRLKIVEFLAVLLRTKSRAVRDELVKLGAIQLVINLFFDYPFNNLLHHHVRSIVVSCIESNDKMLIDHLMVDCDLVSRLLEADENPGVSAGNGKPTVTASGKTPPGIGNLGHVTTIANQLVDTADANPDIQAHLEVNPKWVEWQSGVLQRRNAIEDVYQWTCGRPTTVQDRPVDSDEDDFREKDYDISGMASNLTHEVYRYGMFDNEDGDEGLGMAERDNDDVFFDEESAEVVISSLRLGEEQNRSKDSFLPGPNGFAFQDDRPNQWLGSFVDSNPISQFDEVQGNTSSSSNCSSSDGDVAVGEDEGTASSSKNTYFSACCSSRDSSSLVSPEDGAATVAGERGETGSPVDGLFSDMEKLDVSSSLSSGDLFAAQPLDWASWKEPPPAAPEGTSGRMTFSDNNPFKDYDDTEAHLEVASLAPSLGPESELQAEGMEEGEYQKEGMEGADPLPNHVELTTSQVLAGNTQVSEPLFERGAHVVGVEMDGTTKAMEHAMREGSVGEAVPIHPIKETSQNGELEPTMERDPAEDPDFTDIGYWRSCYSQSVAEVKSL